MIVPSLGVKVLIAMKPVDFRKGMDGLAALVQETLGANPFGGVIYGDAQSLPNRVGSRGDELRCRGFRRGREVVRISG
jgi:hypothetical protein